MLQRSTGVWLEAEEPSEQMEAIQLRNRQFYLSFSIRFVRALFCSHCAQLFPRIPNHSCTAQLPLDLYSVVEQVLQMASPHLELRPKRVHLFLCFILGHPQESSLFGQIQYS